MRVLLTADTLAGHAADHPGHGQQQTGAHVPGLAGLRVGL